MNRSEDRGWRVEHPAHNYPTAEGCFEVPVGSAFGLSVATLHTQPVVAGLFSVISSIYFARIDSTIRTKIETMTNLVTLAQPSAMATPFDWLTFLTMLGEWGIVVVIYHEVETTRLDRFLEIAFSSEHFESRGEIYKEYCALTPPAGRARSIEFLDLLAGNTALRRKCDREISLLERIGNSLPLLPPYRNRALRWFPHTVVFMREILGPYIQQRRESSTSHWAGYFIRFAYLSLREIERQKRKELILLDPDRTRSRDIKLTSQRLSEIRAELKQAKRV